MFATLLPLPPLTLPDPSVVLYTTQASTYAAIAATPEGAHSHRRLCACHCICAAIYVGFALLHLIVAHH